MRGKAEIPPEIPNFMVTGSQGGLVHMSPNLQREILRNLGSDEEEGNARKHKLLVVLAPARLSSQSQNH